MVNAYALIPYENKSSRTHLNGIKGLQRTCHHFIFSWGVGSHVFYSYYLYVLLRCCATISLYLTVLDCLLFFPSSSPSSSSLSSFYSICEFVTCALCEETLSWMHLNICALRIGTRFFLPFLASPWRTEYEFCGIKICCLSFSPFFTESSSIE